jgi:CDGSH-type Zn-finger protein
MSEEPGLRPAGVTIRVRLNGPFVVEGPVTLVDQNGTPFSVHGDKPGLALCRCGHSARKPFCDGSHKHCNFSAPELAGQPL